MARDAAMSAAPAAAPDALERERRRLVGAGLATGAAIVAFVFGWSALAPLSGAVIAPGVVKVDTERKVVAHLEGGIVGAIAVRPGDRVAAGQTLITLVDVGIDASLDLLRTQLDAELARTARLQAERAQAGTVQADATLHPRRTEPRVAELLRRERALFDARRRALSEQLALLDRQRAQAIEEAAARTRQAESDTEALRLQREEIAINEPLRAQGYLAEARLITLRRQLAESQARAGENLAMLAQARQRVVDLEVRAAQARNDYVRQAEDELKQSLQRVYDLQEKLRPSIDAASRKRLVAPVSGEVVSLRVSTVGAVIPPREPVLEIVPDDPQLVVEAMVRPEDVAHVRVGGVAGLRLTAFRQRTTPTVDGTVVHLSADRFVQQDTGAGYYVAHVRADPASLKAAGDLRLRAGMPAEVYVRTAERTMLSYLFDPLLGFAQRGMREP